jgi:hypothetical protein
MIDLLNLIVDLVQFNSDSSSTNFVVEYFKRNMSNNLGQLRDLSSIITQTENTKIGNKPNEISFVCY